MDAQFTNHEKAFYAGSLSKTISEYFHRGNSLARPTSITDNAISTAPDINSDQNHFLSEAASRPDNLLLAEGDELDERYRIIKKLDEQGTVFLADDNKQKHKVALKVVFVDPDAGEAAAHRLGQELRLRDRINDFSHIIRTYDVHTVEFQGYSLVLLAMEYANGGNLRSWLEENKHNDELRASVGLDLFRQACLGIQVIHESGFVHLDIKPENFLLCRNGDSLTVKVSDFGISCELENLSSGTDSDIHMCMANPHYMSPEQFSAARPKDIGKASDIYSLGIVFFEILDGSLPFCGTQAELQERHLRMQPPGFPVKLRRWERIVHQCLAKEASKRYSNVKMLISDLDSAIRGAILSIDVSCPQCTHINVNTNARICENCRGNIETLFRPCPVCARQVRLDIKNCPGCGEAVASHYLLLDRKEQIEKLKDEDPAQAIEVLEIVLREGAGDYKDRAILLVRDLREKQNEIGPLIAKADEFDVSGKVEDAIETWRGVLNVIPRHTVALQKMAKLETILQQFRNNQEKIPHLMDEGNFKEAERLLRQCLELIPAREEIRQLLTVYTQRAGKFKKALKRAKTYEERKLLHKAEEQIRMALSQAEKNAEAQAIQTQVSNAIKETKKLIQQSPGLLSHAQFDEVEKIIAEIEELQIDGKDLIRLKEEFSDTRSKYTALLEASQKAQDAYDLENARQSLIEALVLCPESSQAKSLLKEIEIVQRNARDLIKQVKPLVQAAKFQEAESLLKQVEELWASMKELKSAGDMLKEVRDSYNTNMRNARQAKEEKDLTKALELANFVIAICPESEETASFLEQVQSDQNKANNLTKQAQQMIIAARFEEAKELLGEVEELWVTQGNMVKVKGSLAETQPQYRKHIEEAQRAREKKDLSAALKSAMLAIEICPKSRDAIVFQAETRADQNDAKRLSKRAKTALEEANFESAYALHEQAVNLWENLRGLKNFKEKLTKTQADYSKCMACAKQEGDLGEALRAAESAIEICPKSLQTSELIQDIENRQSQVNRHLKECRQYLKKAEFNNAHEQIEQARKLWPSLSKIQTADQEVSSVSSWFKARMDEAKQQLAKKNFAAATAALDVACNHCPKSREALSLRDQIQRSRGMHLSQRNQRDRKLRKWRAWGINTIFFAGGALAWLSFVVAVPFGVVLLTRGPIAFRLFCIDHMSVSIFAICSLFNLGPFTHIFLCTSVFQYCVGRTKGGSFAGGFLLYLITFLVVIGVPVILSTILGKVLSSECGTFTTFVLAVFALSSAVFVNALSCRSKY